MRGGGGQSFAVYFNFVPESPVWNHSVAIELADKVLFALKNNFRNLSFYYILICLIYQYLRLASEFLCYVSQVLTRIAGLGLGRTLIWKNLAVFNFMNY